MATIKSQNHSSVTICVNCVYALNKTHMLNCKDILPQNEKF